jgi:hypothetical protein
MMQAMEVTSPRLDASSSFTSTSQRPAPRNQTGRLSVGQRRALMMLKRRERRIQVMRVMVGRERDLQCQTRVGMVRRSARAERRGMARAAGERLRRGMRAPSIDTVVFVIAVVVFDMKVVLFAIARLMLDIAMKLSDVAMGLLDSSVVLLTS